MSSITQLSIFNKNTDAFATERGFEYQKLKSLESWLLNSINKNDEIIYYDYEEDIFQRDITMLKSTFRQIKLYSNNFSFASEEISKAVSHFFTLFCMGDYLLDEIKFVFEANSNIARKRTNNEAELLRDWYDNQEGLKEPLLSKCIAITKKIVTEFVDSHDDAIPEIAQAKAKFEQLKSNSDFWEKFTKSINWNFQGVEPEEAMANSLKEIESLVKQLPYPVKDNDIDSIVHSLHFHISQCATKENPEDRLLDAGILENKILMAIGGSEKWYGEQLDKWKSLDKIDGFRLGELYELIGLSRFYRQHQELDGHREIWSSRFIEYLVLRDLPEFSEKDILYELVFLKLCPTREFKFHDPDTTDVVGLVERYFQIVPKSVNDPLTIEETVNLYSIIRAANAFGLIDIDVAKFNAWLKDIESNIYLKLETAKINSQCAYLESLSVIEFNLKNWEDENKAQGFENGIIILKDIVNLSEEAKQYNYSNLLIRINEYIKACLKLKVAEEYPDIVNKLEDISTDLAIIVSKRKGDFSLAIQFRERGINYLRYSENPKDLLRALDYLHRSKNLLFKDETKDGFALVLLNICQVYVCIGYDFAAKYYALAAFYYSVGDEELFKRVLKSVAFIFKIDFNSGSWIHCFMGFERFIVFTGELNPDWDIETNINLRQVLLDYAFVLHSTPQLAPELNILIEHQILELGWIKEEYMDMFFDGLSQNVPTKKQVINTALSKLNDFPLNDIGPERVIQFYGYGILWKIQFINNYDFNANGEEFCAICQILFGEIKIHYPDFQFADKIESVQINLLEDDKPVPPKLISDSQIKFEWDIHLQKIAKPKPYYPIVLSTILSVLKGLDENNRDDLTVIFEDLLRKKDLGSKTTVVKSYEELHKSFYSEKEFDKFIAHAFNKLNIDINFVRKNGVVD